METYTVALVFPAYRGYPYSLGILIEWKPVEEEI